MPIPLFYEDYHTHKYTQHTQGPEDWHTHINIYLHHLLCAYSSYLYDIKWLNEQNYTYRSDLNKQQQKKTHTHTYTNTIHVKQQHNAGFSFSSSL